MTTQPRLGRPLEWKCAEHFVQDSLLFLGVSPARITSKWIASIECEIAFEEGKHLLECHIFADGKEEDEVGVSDFTGELSLRMYKGDSICWKFTRKPNRA